MLCDSAEEEEKLRVSRTTDLRDWNSESALMFISGGQDSHRDQRPVDGVFTLTGFFVERPEKRNKAALTDAFCAADAAFLTASCGFYVNEKQVK